MWCNEGNHGARGALNPYDSRVVDADGAPEHLGGTEKAMRRPRRLRIIITINSRAKVAKKLLVPFWRFANHAPGVGCCSEDASKEGVDAHRIVHERHDDLSASESGALSPNSLQYAGS